MNRSFVLFLMYIASAAAEKDDDRSMYDFIQFLVILGVIVLAFSICASPWPGLDYPIQRAEQCDVVRVQIVGGDVPKDRV